MASERTQTEQEMETQAGSAGRPLTPRDLAARRRFYEDCASLSPEAALLAVLVEGIGERERIMVRPAELSRDLRRRLHWRDIPGSITAKLIGVWLKSLGFDQVGRGAQGVKYEIRWEHLWALDPREVSARPADFDVHTLGGAELLRMLAVEQGLFFAPRLWCARCERVVGIVWGESTTESCVCLDCAGPTRLLDPAWLERASRRVRSAIQRDPELLRRVKAEWEEVHDGAPLPPLPEPFTWLNAAWEWAGKPTGRPAALLRRYDLAHVVDRLESAGVLRDKIEQLFAAGDDQRLSLYRALPLSIGRFLGSSAENELGELPRVDRHTLWASVDWARRQWTNPACRARDERLFPPGRLGDEDNGQKSRRGRESESCLKCGGGPLSRGICERGDCP